MTSSSSPVAVVVGTGLIGASIGCALTAAGYQVHLEDRQSSHARVAAGLGAGTVEPPDPAEVSLVVAAVPPDAIAAVVVDSLEAFQEPRSPTSARSRPGCWTPCGGGLST